MKNLNDYIGSGILEAYVLGLTDPKESLEVEQLAAENEEILNEINRISEDFEGHVRGNAVAPPSTIKPFLMATIDYTERLSKGETPASPPILHKGSKISDYAEWLNRDDMVLPADFKDMYAKIIGYTPDVSTAIAWMRSVTIEEVHDHEIEKFLVVEGSCCIKLGETAHNLVAGDYFEIPLYNRHIVHALPDVVCKIILQRIAA